MKGVNYEKVFKLITSPDWKNYDVERFVIDGTQLTPEEIASAHKMSILFYDHALDIKRATPSDLTKIKVAAIKFAENPHSYMDVTALLRESRA